MSIETYANTMIYFFLALFLLSVLADVIVILSIIRKKPLKYWRIMVWSTLYALFAMFNTSIAYIAYDDPSDPNFWRYENWNLHDFVVSDIKMLIFLVISRCIDLPDIGKSERKENRNRKQRRKIKK